MLFIDETGVETIPPFLLPYKLEGNALTILVAAHISKELSKKTGLTAVATPVPDKRNLRKVRSNKKADKVARDNGYKDAHDAKKGRGESKVDIYEDKTTGEHYLWDGNPDSEVEEL